MSAVLKAQERSARYLAAVAPPLVQQFDLLATAPGGVARLRELIFTLAIRGKLVPQESDDEPATTLLRHIAERKARMFAEGALRRFDPPQPLDPADEPYALPPGWAWARFGEVSINRDGERVPVSSSDRASRAKLYDYYGASGAIDKIDGYLFDKTLLLIGEDGANLINRATPIAFLAHGKYWVNNHAHVIDTTHASLMDYLKLYINAISLEAYVTGTAQPKMNQAKLNSIAIAVPPLAEQPRIVARVDELMRLCDALEAKGRLEAEHHQQLLTTLLGTLTDSRSPEELAANWQRVADHFDLLLDRPEVVDELERAIQLLAVRGVLLKQDPMDEPASAVIERLRTERARGAPSTRQQRVEPTAAGPSANGSFELPAGWAWAEAQELSSASSTITYGILKPEWVERGVPTVRVQDMQGGQLLVSNVGQCAPARAEKFGKTRLLEGDLLIAKDGATLGKTAFVPKALDGGNITQHVLRFSIASSVNRDYVRLVIDSPHGQSWMRGETQGVALPGVNVGDFRRMPVPVPPTVEQTRIVARVTELRRLCSDLRQRLVAGQAVQAHLADALVETAATA